MNKRVNFLLFAGTVLFGVNCAFFELSCVDVGFHVRTGELVVQNGTIPATNIFSFTQPEQSWLLHQWLPSILFYGAWVCGQVPGLILTKALVIGLICGIVCLCAARLSGKRAGYWHYWLVFGMALAARPRFFARPFIFSALLLGVLQYSIAVTGARSRKLLFLVPLLMALWANVHAGVLYGLVYIVAFWAGAVIDFTLQRQGDAPEGGQVAGSMASALYASRRLVGAAILSVILMFFTTWLINPHGPKVIMLPVIYFLDPFWQDFIQEFRSPTGNRLALLIYWTGALLVLQGLAFRRSRWSLALPAAVFVAMAFRSERILLTTFVVTVPYAVFLLSRVEISKRVGAFQGHGYLLPIAWIAATFFVLLPDPSLRYGAGVEQSFHPRPIFSFMKKKAAGMRIFNDMRYGGGLLLWAYPEIRPFIDGRCEAYSKGFWKDVYVPAASGLKWRGVFGRYGIDGAIVPLGKQTSPGRLARELYEDSGWALVAYDDRTLFFLSRESREEAFFQSHEFRLIWPGDRTLKTISTQTADEAIREAERALEFDGNGVFARTAYARALLVAGRFKDAARQYRLLTLERKVSEQYWRDYVYSLYMAGKYRELLPVLEKMMDDGLLPEYAESLRHLLKVRRGAGGKKSGGVGSPGRGRGRPGE